MRNPTTVVQRCTAQRANGEFCDMPSAPEMPFPICTRHALRVYEQIQYHLDTGVARLNARVRGEAPKPAPDEAERRAAAQAAQSVVYYVRIGDHIKIGTTVNLRTRLVGLRVDKEALMATEPGGRELERQRHLEFADERVGRRENFNPSQRLLMHIDRVVYEHGEPKITSYVKAEHSLTGAG